MDYARFYMIGSNMHVIQERMIRVIQFSNNIIMNRIKKSRLYRWENTKITHADIVLLEWWWKYNINTIKYQPKIKDTEIEWYNLPGFAISRE